MKTKYILCATIAAIIIGGALGYMSYYLEQQKSVSVVSSQTTQNSGTALLEQRLAECGSIPNGGTENVADTSRMFISIPKDLYPEINVDLISHGATANYISNAGQYGYAMNGQGSADCWSYYFEFDGAGSVDIGSKSGVSGVPDYLIHVEVGSATSTNSISTTTTGTGTLQGTMSIGPICPVEQVGHPCEPSPQTYAAHQVFVYDASRTHLIATLTPDASGNFQASLPVGTYIVDVTHQSIGAVQGAPATVVIKKGETAPIAISIDTGIR